MEGLPEFREAKWVWVDGAVSQYPVRLAVLRSSGGGPAIVVKS